MLIAILIIILLLIFIGGGFFGWMLKALSEFGSFKLKGWSKNCSCIIYILLLLLLLMGL